MKKKLLCIIPARAGSLRVKGKNTREFHDHPLIAYTISIARQSGIFDRIVVSTNCPRTQKIALHYGAEAPFLRPEEISGPKSIDVEFLKHAFGLLGEEFEAFSILRPTSPFRRIDTLKRAYAEFLDTTVEKHSIRAVQLVTEHPGKMWTIEDNLLKPLLAQDGMEVPWHARQYQDLPKVYVQNSSLEIAHTFCVTEHNSREGKILAPFLTDETEGFAIDYEQDWMMADLWIKTGKAELPSIDVAPFKD